MQRFKPAENKRTLNKLSAEIWAREKERDNSTHVISHTSLATTHKTDIIKHTHTHTHTRYHSTHPQLHVACDLCKHPDGLDEQLNNGARRKDNHGPVVSCTGGLRAGEEKVSRCERGERREGKERGQRGKSERG